MHAPRPDLPRLVPRRSMTAPELPIFPQAHVLYEKGKEQERKNREKKEHERKQQEVKERERSTSPKIDRNKASARRLQKIKSVNDAGDKTALGKGWIPAPPYPNNEARLEKLRSYHILDTPPEIPYDDITRIAACICASQMAAISFVEESRQWVKAKVNIDVDETPLDVSFCAHTILDPNKYMEVSDATKDVRFLGNPYVTCGTLRFYAGASLVTPDEWPLGALCVIDSEPRKLNPEQVECLRALSRLVIDQLEARQKNVELIALHKSLQEAHEKLERANAELTKQNSCLREQIIALGKVKSKPEIELSAPVSRVVDLLYGIHDQITDNDQKVQLQEAIHIISTHKLYEVDVGEAVQAGKNVDDDTKGFLLTQLDSPTARKKDNLFLISGFPTPLNTPGENDDSADESMLLALDASNDDVVEARVQIEGGALKSMGCQYAIYSPRVTPDKIEPKPIGFDLEYVDNLLAQAKDLLKNVQSWDFDVFHLSAETKQPLFYATLATMRDHDLLSKLPIPVAKLVSFLKDLENGYIHSNPYHNNTHAADVMLGSNYIVATSGILKHLTPIEHLGLLLAAAAHDVGHLGVNNIFLIQTAHQLAIEHNDKSVQENYHSVQAFRMLYKSKNNIFENFSLVERQEIRKLMIELILATDMSQHVDIFNTFQTLRNSEKGLDLANDKQARFLALKMVIKCADISNSAKRRPLYLNWADRVMEEFWLQGDRERKLAMPISAFMDRTQPDKPKCQTGFMQFIALPFYTAMAEQFPPLAHFLDNMKDNMQYWKSN